jgi:sortase A
MNDVAKAGARRGRGRYWGVQRWMESLLLAAGMALLFGYLAARIHGAVMYRVGLWNFVRLTSTPSLDKANGVPAALASVHFAPLPESRIGTYAKALAAKFDTPMAVLSIPRLQLAVPVFDGTDRLTLNRGAGRIFGTARPGELGNIGIAAHRDGFFRSLKDIQMGDQIELAIPRQTLLYTVDNIALVGPDNVGMLQARTRPSLTLVTCYPFYFVGDAPRRYIVQASLTNSDAAGSELSGESKLSTQTLATRRKDNEFR